MDELIEELITNNINKGNTYFLTKIGEMIKSIRDIKPTQAHQLVQMLKYGGSYEELLNEISRLTNISKQEIEHIFSLYAQKDLNFARNFYEYRNIPFIPFEQNIALKTQTQALANLTNQTLQNFTRSRALGYTLYDINGNPQFTGLRETYEKVLDEALLNVGQGKDTFNNSMSRLLKELGESGLKTLDYASGRSIRLDSMARMHLQSGLRELHNENQRLLGEEFGADGIEISVHLNPAEDHAEAQGRQFAYEQFNLLQDTGIAKDYTGKQIDMTTGSEKISHRPISEYNCYHYTFAIILGVSKPQYSNEELQQIIKDNKKGFEFEGKHYTNYEGTQLQRAIERNIREQKDIQIMAKASDNKEMIYSSQNKITQLSNKYKELSSVSGLPMKKDRLKVSGYKRVKVDVEKPVLEKPIEKEIFNYDEYKNKLESKKVYLKDDLTFMDAELFERNIKQLDNLTDKYNITTNQSLDVDMKSNPKHIGTTWYRSNRIGLNFKYFGKKEDLLSSEIRSQDYNWHNKVKKENLDVYTITHEFGHVIENDYVRRYLKKYKNIDTNIKKDFITGSEDLLRKNMDKEIRDDLFSYIRKKEKLSITEIKNKYFSGYGKSKPHYEWFAETFAQYELGEQNLLTEAMGDWLERNIL